MANIEEKICEKLLQISLKLWETLEELRRNILNNACIWSGNVGMRTYLSSSRKINIVQNWKLMKSWGFRPMLNEIIFLRFSKLLLGFCETSRKKRSLFFFNARGCYSQNPRFRICDLSLCFYKLLRIIRHASIFWGSYQILWVISKHSMSYLIFNKEIHV